MHAIAQDHRPSALWQGLIRTIAQLLAQRDVHAARTVVLVPYAQLMPLARKHWAREVPNGFAPRFETTMNWAGRSGFVPDIDDLSFDMGRDLLAARTWLDRAGLGTRADLLAGRLVETAWQLGAVAAAVPLTARPAWAAKARAVVALGADAPALTLETAVARIAVEWAAASAYATDALLQEQLTQTLDLLIVLEGFQTEPMAQALKSLLGDKAITLPLDVATPTGEIGLHEAADPSHEAEIAAACVIRHIDGGNVPVALAAVDRVLTRRIRAMLDARGIAIRDETGWKLSTTRAAAHVMGTLRACAWNASSDAVLDWLKNSPAAAPRTVSALERRVRRDGLRDWTTVQAQRLGESGNLALLMEQVNGWRGSLQRARRLPEWLEALRQLLRSCGRWPQLEGDGAGAQLLSVLRLSQQTQDEGQQWPHGAALFNLAGFTAWASDVLEAATFVPPQPEQEQVVILPFNQLLGRAMGALVMPGCDEVRLPPSPEPAGPWTAAQREGLGLPSRDALEAAVRAGWRHALQTPHCDVLWRRSDDSGDPLLASALVQSVQLQAWASPAEDPRELRALQPQPVARPLPIGSALKIDKLSASAYEDLRRCPYRFFALRQLGLQQADEIDSELDKRDFGNWLHAVLRSFHESLQNSWEAPGAGRARLLDIAAEEVTRSLGLEEGEFLPFAAAWPQVRDGYLVWLAGHEASGAKFEQAESEHEIPLGSVKLVGRIDRIDRMPDGRVMVMNYKTEARAVTGERIKQPGEDTQLAFYAALLDEDTLRAAYVNVGERGKTETLEQHAVVEGRELLVHGILDDLARIAGGASLPALGEGKVCDFCAARGLCRKDFWS